ncbi:hypothetical protein ACIQK9_08985 [Streptomyces hydrogenans]|uniref:effector-associated constant component EACC1 n=1 Tax=Streptomyces hydrogenans TaxID=1873719 RepID=UPI0035D95067
MSTYRVSVIGESGGGEDLQRLTEWLRDDEEVGEAATLSLTSAPAGPGDMGVAFDAVQLVVDSGFQVANLVLAVSLWRRGRAKAPVVVIERDGVRVTVDSEDPEAIARVAAAFTAE